MQVDQVVLVDEQDRKIGLMDKLEAHKGEGTLHRAISVLLYRKKDGKTEVLLQKRGKAKPLWPFFWSDTTSTHPRDGESYEDCAVRRLKEEMGIALQKDEVKPVTKILYHERYNEIYSEWELDAILLGTWDGQPRINRQECDGYMWMRWKALKKEVADDPKKYPPWMELMVKNKKVMQAILSV